MKTAIKDPFNQEWDEVIKPVSENTCFFLRGQIFDITVESAQTFS